MDMFVVPTVSFDCCTAFDIAACAGGTALGGVTALPNAQWVAQQLAHGWKEMPRYLIRDRDCAYGEVPKRRIGAMGSRDRPISARSPWQKGYAERPSDPSRRDCLDHVVVFGERHLRQCSHPINDTTMRLERICHSARTHQRRANSRWPAGCFQFLGGLHHQYVRI